MEADAVRAQFPKLQPFRSELESVPDWPYLLFCASILAPSDFPAAEEKALRIAQSALTDQNCTVIERDAALIILDALSNRRAVQLAEERGRVKEKIEGRLGTVQSIDWLRRAFENRIEFGNGRWIHANKFQRRFWAAASTNNWLSVSAPTSAGKSYILAQWLAGRLASNQFQRIVYIAPTRALVQQVENDLRLILSESSVTDVQITSIPWSPVDTEHKQNIHVFTQERLHYFLQRARDVTIDAIVIDEAHKLGDSHRGILLQDVIEQVVASNPNVTVIFTAPLAENPGVLLADAPEFATKSAFRSDDATVNQNLLWLEPDRSDPKVWQLLLRRGESSLPLGTFETQTRLSTIKSRLATLAILSDTGEGGILVYANGAAQAEDFAEEIANRLPQISQTRRVRALDELCGDTIHKEYRLRKVLRKGVAYHYGNMPLLLRTAIEDLFRDGEIKYLVCTSTLVEGVNLPCRSIIIRAPKKGMTKRMAPADFWNLAGRAGRWGKEFQGNVICVDTQDTEAWGTTLPTTRSRYSIERTTDRVLEEEIRLLDYISAGSPSDRARSDQDLETAVSYFAGVRRKYGSLRAAPWHDRIDAEKLARVDDVLKETLSQIEVPPDWIYRHAGISPFAMHRMIEALLKLQAPIDNFLPIDPESPEASGQYGRIFEMLGHNMTTVFGQGGRCLALGILTTNWMMGYPIKRIIASRIAWNKKKKKGERTSASILKTLEDVEQIARFQAPRYLACYSDIARHVLDRQGLSEKAVSIPDVTLSLEFGVRGPIQLGLMSLGLSRSSTLAIAEAVAAELPLDESASSFEHLLAAALVRVRVSELGVPSLIGEEVQQMQSRLSRYSQTPMPENEA